MMLLKRETGDEPAEPEIREHNGQYKVLSGYLERQANSHCHFQTKNNVWGKGCIIFG